MKPQPYISAGARVTYHGLLGTVLETPKPGEDVLLELDDDDCITSAPAKDLLPLKNIHEVDKGKLLTTYSKSEWAKAEERAAMCRMIACSTKIPRAIEAAARELGICSKTMGRWWEIYCNDARTSVLIDKKPGRKSGSRALDVRQEELIDASAKTLYLIDRKPKLSALIEAVKCRCHLENIASPSDSTIRRRMLELDKSYVVKRRHGHKRYCDKYQPVPGHLGALRKMQIVEIDHTLADIILVSDDEYRLPIGRPWVTLAICTKTKMIVGTYVSLEAPSSISLAMCVLSMLVPKDQIVSYLGFELLTVWPGSSPSEEISTDNGKEFHGISLQRGCAQYGMSLRFRPVRTPRWGGTIERLIDTMMGRLTLLPGATQRDVRERDNKKVEAQACMTLNEFAQWFYTEITTHYHQTVHRALGVTPIQKWKELSADEPPREEWSERQIIQCFVHFLPSKEHPITRTGIQHEGLQYWADGLIPYVADERLYDIRYDPRDIRRVYFVTKEGEVIIVPCVEEKPAISFDEWKRVRRDDRARGEASVDWLVRTTGHEENCLLVASCTAKQKKARRNANKQRERRKEVEKLATLTPDSGPQAPPPQPENCVFVPRSLETMRIEP
jgi:putative transposase